jgi:hypothetical protein
MAENSVLLTFGNEGVRLVGGNRLKEMGPNCQMFEQTISLITTFFEHCIFLLLSCLLISGCRADPEKHELSLEANAHLLYEKK